MRAAVFREVGKPLSLETVPDPVPQPGQVILEVSHAGICGSDLHWTEMPGMLKPGTILGHEFAGTIADANGSALAVGTRVTALPVFPCWTCDECNAGHYAFCDRQGVVGFTRPGAFAGAVAVDARLVQVLPDGVSFDEGALIEPLAVGYRAVSMARAPKGANVLIMGAGPIGAAVGLFTVMLGAANVVVSEPSAGRRELALALGATAAVDPRSEDIGARFREICGTAPDLVIECAGIPGMIDKAVQLVRAHGQLIVVGVCNTEDSFMPVKAVRKELAVNFSYAYQTKEFDAVIDALARERIKPEPLITDRVTLDEFPLAFEALRKPSTQCKVLVTM